MQYYVSAHQWIDASLSNIDNVFPVLKESIQAVFVKEISGLEGAKKLAGKMVKSPSSNEGDTVIGREPLATSEASPSQIKQEQDNSNANRENSTKPDTKTGMRKVHASDVKSGLVGFILGTIIMFAVRLYSPAKWYLFSKTFREYYESKGKSTTHMFVFDILPQTFLEVTLYAFICGFTAIAIARTLVSNQLRKEFIWGTTASLLVICSIAIIWVSVEPIGIQRSYLLRVAPYILLANCATGLLFSFINRLVRKLGANS